jgi:hypothetical protein
MNIFKRDLFISRLTQKCRIQGEPVYRSKGTFEFIVNRLYNVNSSIRMGVQVTDSIRNFLALRHFLNNDEGEPFVDLRAYVEVHPEVDASDWGPDLLYNALVAYVFQQGEGDKSIRGIRIHPDVSYEFFDIESSSFEKPMSPS